LIFIFHVIDHCVAFITIFTPIPCKGIPKQSFFHSGFHAQVDHRFFFAVVESGHQRNISSAVEHLHLIDHFRREIFRCHFGVVAEKFFAIYQYFFYFTTIHRYLAVTADFHTGHFFE
jgi:hypothetical protein